MFSFYGRNQTAAGEVKLPCSLRKGISKAGWPFRVALSWGWEAGPSHPHVANSLIAGHPRRGHDLRWGDSLQKRQSLPMGFVPWRTSVSSPSAASARNLSFLRGSGGSTSQCSHSSILPEFLYEYASKTKQTVLDFLFSTKSGYCTFYSMPCFIRLTSSGTLPYQHIESILSLLS